ncbi:hypothetical protein [Salinisphaera sp. Q1T1-3]|uniref:hypothetical protein n=1 Tax=Salinisphaera sp. Q1T1-3 TaxID=2321229 RepID=UPI0011C43A84|nr:hypothetical protein [Salinisphaera sp. Q1T1-3]
MSVSAPAATSATDGVVDLRLASLVDQCEGTAPVTFGQAFRPGDVPRSASLALMAGDTALPTQVDAKARNADGSLRHAVITVDVPCSQRANQSLVLARRHAASAAGGRALTIDDVLATDYDSGIIFDAGNQTWQSSARAVLSRIRREGGCAATTLYCRHWLDGPLAGEWVVGAPPTDSNGRAHPRLMVFFAVRAYGPAPVTSVRTDTVVENDWAYDVEPSNVSYNAQLITPGQAPFTVDRLTHYRQARWHHVAWWGRYDRAPWFAALNGRYLQATPAVPRYEQVTLDKTMMANVRRDCAPMDHCDVNPRMESTGAQSQIGPLPTWSAAYVIHPQDYRAYRWMLANSDALGAYHVHYRQRDTGDVLSVDAHPCATLIGPAERAKCDVPPHGDDRLPACQGDCDSPLNPELAHAGAPAYVAYLVTGDWYYAQELSFWADWTVFQSNPGYRNYRAGLFKGEQLRGQAWALRTLGDAAYLLADDDPQKAFFTHVVDENIKWYNASYSDNPAANALGVITNGYAMSYSGPDGTEHVGIAPWQASFFTWAAGNLADQGFPGAEHLRRYVARLQIGTLTAPGFCPEMASAYSLKVRPERQAPLYKRFADVYRASFPEMAGAGCDARTVNAALRQRPDQDGFSFPPGTMAGYPDSDTGFVANLQIGAASAASTGEPAAAEGWRWFMARPVRPDYSRAPQFAILPSRPVAGDR